MIWIEKHAQFPICLTVREVLAQQIVINSAPHTTQVFQLLDLTVFGVLKQRRGMNCRSMTIMRRSHA
jgi:hypothetical protein